LAAAAVQVVLVRRTAARPVSERQKPLLPITKAVRQTKGSAIALPMLVIAGGLALFYPPMLPTH